MKQKLVDFIKYTPWVFTLYNKLGSIVIRFIGLFIKINPKKILFVSFGGKKYDDSPQSIYEEMIKRAEFLDYKFVWAFVDTNRNIPGNAKKIKIDSFEYFLTALSSKFWIINVSAERGLNFKKKNTICINTWHGTPIKKIYGEENVKTSKKRRRKPEKFDLVCAQSKYDQNIYARIFGLNSENIIISDLPRNDCLLAYSRHDVKSIKRKLDIPEYKKVILYMPTYREYDRDTDNACLFTPPINLKKWKSILGEEYVFLFRAHYLVVKNMNVEENDFVKEVSDYPQLSDLYVVSDLMISDYSSAFFDYAILERPELCFAYDLEKYGMERGLYIDLKDELPCSIDENEDVLITHILNLDYQKASEETRKFKQKYTPNAGHATNTVINEIAKRYMQ